MLTALRGELTIDEAAARGVLHANGDWRLLPAQEMARRWCGRDEGLRESARIADACAAFDFAWMRPPMPTFAFPAGYDDMSFLREKTYEGARERWPWPLTAKQIAQIDHELAIIGRLRFSGFFLVMWDA